MLGEFVIVIHKGFKGVVRIARRLSARIALNHKGGTMLVRTRQDDFSSTSVTLNNRFSSPPLTMELDQFFEFSFWLAEELTDLESRFASQHVAAISSNQTFDANGLPDNLEIDLF